MPYSRNIGPGSRLGPYELLALLGAGGMGEVWRARDPRLEREVALKLLLPEGASAGPTSPAADTERLARLEREARILASLDHPNIVTIHSVEEAGGVRFLTMELVEGTTLDGLVPAGGMALDRFLDVAVPLADALAAAHARGILHRDLKPGNVMVTEDGRVKVLDFGLAKLAAAPPEDLTQIPTATLEGLTREGQLAGTVPYMSPEQARGLPADARSDLFSLGVVLYEMATGDRPFRGESAAEVLSSVLRDEPASVDELRPDLPRDLSRILRRCLAKDPERRLQSAKDLRNELQELGAEIPAPATRAPAAEPADGAGSTARQRLAWVGGGLLGALLVVAGLLVGRGDDPGEQRRIRSLAVLPLENLSGDPEEEYFADGMTDALIADLARIGALRVISRTSVMQYKGARRSLPDIARELDVDAVVEGSVVRVGDRVRIRAQLIHAPTDGHLWTNSYEHELRDVLRLQNEVASAIAREIVVQLTPKERERLAEGPTVDPRAHELYLRGLHAWNQRTSDSLRQAIEHFEAAIEIDPRYAHAHAGLASTYVLLGYFDEEPTEAVERGIAAARAALAIDESLADGHAALGVALAHYEWDLPAAERALRRAIEESPSHAHARFWYAAHALAPLGRIEEATEQIERGRQLDPVSPIINAGVSWIHYLAGRWEPSLEVADRVLELAPDYPVGMERRSAALRQMGRYDEAIDTARRYVEVTARSVRAKAELAASYAAAGRPEEARKILDELEAEAKHRYVSSLRVGRVHALLGETDVALASLERAMQERAWGLVHLAVDPDFASLRADPRFRRLLGRLGLSP